MTESQRREASRNNLQTEIICEKEVFGIDHFKNEEGQVTTYDKHESEAVIADSASSEKYHPSFENRIEISLTSPLSSNLECKKKRINDGTK